MSLITHVNGIIPLSDAVEDLTLFFHHLLWDFLECVGQSEHDFLFSFSSPVEILATWTDEGCYRKDLCYRPQTTWLNFKDPKVIKEFLVHIPIFCYIQCFISIFLCLDLEEIPPSSLTLVQCFFLIFDDLFPADP